MGRPKVIAYNPEYGECLCCRKPTEVCNDIGCHPHVEPPRKDSNPKDRVAAGRLDLSLFPDTAVAYGALAMTEGDAKYGGYNYRVAGVRASVYVAAARRHLAKWFNGERCDSRTGVPHLASVLGCVGILVDAIECGKLNDDRPPKYHISGMIETMEKTVARIHELHPDGPGRYRENPDA